jgi:hypothetical protein
MKTIVCIIVAFGALLIAATIRSGHRIEQECARACAPGDYKFVGHRDRICVCRRTLSTGETIWSIP